MKLLNYYTMIQRIQSVYMFLTTLLPLLFLKGSFLTFIDKSGSVIKLTLAGILRNSNGQMPALVQRVLPIMVMVILIPVLSLITLLLYKNLKIQKKLSVIVIILVSGFILASIYYSWYVMSEFDADLVPGFKMMIPVVMLILSVLAHRGITKDDDLLKSYDRLR